MSSIGHRIFQARRLQGLSLRALAEHVGVSHTMLNKYEKGVTTPDSAMLIRIAKGLETNLDFFLRPVRVGTIKPAYRKHSRLTGKKLGQIEETIRDWLERYLETEAVSPSGSDSQFVFPDGFPRQVQSFADVEDAAVDLRTAWSIGLDPIEDMTALLEDKGVRVGVIDAPDHFNACAFSVEHKGFLPVVAMRDGMPGDRQRFTLAHELGHLVLDVLDGNEKGWNVEKACHRFAGAFLAPEPTIRSDLGASRTNFAGAELHMLKHKYGMSMQALVHRAHDLNIISDSSAKSLYRTFSKNGWRKAEPGEPVPPSRPARFRRLIHQALAEEVISRRRATQLYKEEIETPTEREAFAVYHGRQLLD